MKRVEITDHYGGPLQSQWHRDEAVIKNALGSFFPPEGGLMTGDDFYAAFQFCLVRLLGAGSIEQARAAIAYSKLPQADREQRCPKCGNDRVLLAHCAKVGDCPHASRESITEDHIHRDCSCGYSWLERCLDHCAGEARLRLGESA